MKTARLEAFSDAVIAIIITVMVLELRVPEHHDWAGLWHDTGLSLLAYVLSFVYLGIYWNNHHHMLQLTPRVTGSVLWANLHLLFWLSLYPFTTLWMAESDLARTPTTLYAINLLAAAIAYFVLQSRILSADGSDGELRRALGTDVKGKISPVLYSFGILFAAVSGEEARWATAMAIAIFVLVAIIWVIPDRRIEKAVIDAHAE
ncbi:MAG TPA: TMEM175 family protein [Aeromicrobium sp.]|nr:TMEM175 family protein [Aeromicrobium sp.]